MLSVHVIYFCLFPKGTFWMILDSASYSVGHPLVWQVDHLDVCGSHSISKLPCQFVEFPIEVDYHIKVVRYYNGVGIGLKFFCYAWFVWTYELGYCTLLFWAVIFFLHLAIVITYLLPTATYILHVYCIENAHGKVSWYLTYFTQINLPDLHEAIFGDV